MFCYCPFLNELLLRCCIHVISLLQNTHHIRKAIISLSNLQASIKPHPGLVSIPPDFPRPAYLEAPWATSGSQVSTRHPELDHYSIQSAARYSSAQQKRWEVYWLQTSLCKLEHHKFKTRGYLTFHFQETRGYLKII